IRGQRFISIAEFRDMYQSDPLTIASKDKNEDLFITGVVISDVAHGNNPEGRVIVQGYADGELRGIALAIDGAINRYQPGDSVMVKVEGAVLERVDGILQVSDLTVLEVGRLSAGNEQKVHLATD